MAVLVGEVKGGHRPVVNAELAGDELHGDGLVHTLAGHFGLDECVQLLRVLAKPSAENSTLSLLS